MRICFHLVTYQWVVGVSGQLMVNLRRVFSSLGYLGVYEHPACISVFGTAVVGLCFSQMHLLKGSTTLSRRQGASRCAGRAVAERVQPHRGF